MDEPIDPSIRVFEICMSGVAVDGRGIDQIWIKHMAESTKHMMDPRIQGIKPPIKPYHDRLTTSMTPYGDPAIVQTGADNSQKALGYLLDIWAAPRVIDPTELGLWAKVKLTPEAQAGFDSGEYNGVSIGENCVGFTNKGRLAGAYIGHLMACGVDEAAFPGLQLTSALNASVTLAADPVQKMQPGVNTNVVKSNKNGVTLKANASKDLKMDYSEMMKETVAALTGMATGLTQLCDKMMKATQAETAPPGAHDEPDGDEPAVGEGDQPAEDKGDDKTETQKMSVQMSADPAVAAMQAQMAKQQTEIEAMKKKNVELEMNRLHIPQNKRATFMSIAMTSGLDQAVALVDGLAVKPPQGTALASKPAADTEDGKIENAIRGQYNGIDQVAEVSLAGAMERNPHLARVIAFKQSRNPVQGAK